VKRNAVLGKASRLGLPMRKLMASAVELQLNEQLGGKSAVKIRQSAPRRREIIIPPETDPRKIAQRKRHADRILSAMQAERLPKPKGRSRRQPTPQIKARVAPDDVIKRVAPEGRAKALTAASTRRLIAKRTSQPADARRFEELQSSWLATVRYLARFAHLAPNASDIVAARKRLATVEAAWLDLHGQAHDKAFVWPSTEAEKGFGSIAAGEWAELGMLYLGYGVSLADNLSDAFRQELLASIFRSNLPPLNSIGYMRAWGSPQSSPRLHKMAVSLASFVRMQKLRGRRSALAIGRWEADLHYLKQRFYVGRFDDFSWPKP
jgi:hypothetical protein